MIASGKKVGLEMKWNNESKRETRGGNCIFIGGTVTRSPGLERAYVITCVLDYVQKHDRKSRVQSRDIIAG